MVPVKRTTVVVMTYALAWFLLNVFRAALPVLLPELRRLYDVGFTDAGIVFALLFAGVALMQFPSGVIADAVGDRKVVFASLVCSSALLAAFAFATTVPALFALGFAFGIAVGGFRSVAISAVTKAVGDERRSRALGAMATGNPMGNLLGPVLAAVGILSLGVIGMPLVLGAVGMVSSLGLGVVLFRDGFGNRSLGNADRLAITEEQGQVRHRVRRTVKVLTSRFGLLIVIASLTYAMAWQGVFSFLPTYLVEVRELPLDGSGVVTGITFGVGIVGNIVGGRIADRVGDSPTLFGGFVLGAMALGGLRSATALPVAVASLVMLGLAMGVITPARDGFISRLSGPNDRGSVVGGVRTTYILLASAGTAFAGAIIDAVGFGGAFLLFASVLGVGALAALALAVLVPDNERALV